MARGNGAELGHRRIHAFEHGRVAMGYSRGLVPALAGVEKPQQNTGTNRYFLPGALRRTRQHYCLFGNHFFHTPGNVATASAMAVRLGLYPEIDAMTTRVLGRSRCGGATTHKVSFENNST